MDESGQKSSPEPDLEQTLFLVRNAQRSEPCAADALFERVSPVLQAWVYKRIAIHFRGRLDPDELTNEVWIRVCEILPRFDAECGRFRPWLFRVAKFVSLEMLRAQSRLPRTAGGVGEEGPLHQPRSAALRLSQILARNEMVETFRRKFDELSGRDQDLVINLGLEGKTAEATAQLLGGSPAAVEKAWQRLRDRIRQDPVLRRAVFFDGMD